jgi:transposase-like protein
MRLWIRAALLIVGLGAVARWILLPAMSERRWGVPEAAWMIGFLVVANLVFYAALRCPYCHRWVVRRPNGSYSPFVGFECPHCKRSV